MQLETLTLWSLLGLLTLGTLEKDVSGITNLDLLFSIALENPTGGRNKGIAEFITLKWPSQTVTDTNAIINTKRNSIGSVIIVMISSYVSRVQEISLR